MIFEVSDALEEMSLFGFPGGADKVARISDVQLAGTKAEEPRAVDSGIS